MSQQDLNAFADWLVANPNKKGTPQYDTIAKAFQELDGQVNPKDTSFSSAFQSGIDAPLENMATTARMLGADGTADTLSGLTQAPTNYESASDRFMNPEEGDFTIAGFAPEYLPRAAAEQAGQFAGSLATRVGGGAVGLAVSGGNPLAAAGGALAGPALFEFVQQLGPVAAQRAANNGRSEPTWEDWSAAAATAGVSGALNAIGVKGFSGAGLLNRTLKEGATETAQSVVEQTGSSAGTDAGLQVDPKQAIGEGIIGGTSAGGIGVATDTAVATGKGVKNLSNRVFNPEDGLPTDPEAAADLATTLTDIAEANGYDLNDIDKMSTKGARETVDKAHVQMAETLKQLAADLKAKLQVNNSDPDVVAVEKILAKAAQRQARNKTKNTVGAQEMDAVSNLVGNTAEGQQMMKIMRQMNELTELHNSGYQGGLSKITDQFMPFGGSVGYDSGAVATERMLRPILSGGAALQTGGASLLGQAALAGAGRIVDKITGRRSTVRRFIEKNKANQGISVLNKPSEKARILKEAEKAKATTELERQQREQARQEKQAADKEFAIANAQSNAPATPSSPQDTLQQATGLDRQGVAVALRALKKRARTNKAIQGAIKNYQKSVGIGGYVPRLSPLIRQVNQIADANSSIGKLRQAQPDKAVEQRQEMDEVRRAEGKAENQRINRELFDAVDKDPNISDTDKAIAKVALDRLNRGLGADPVFTARDILTDAQSRMTSPEAAMTYIKPYVDMVVGQQRNRTTQ